MSGSSSIELKQRNQLREDVGVDVREGEPLANQTTAQKDRDDLARVGKREVLKVSRCLDVLLLRLRLIDLINSETLASYPSWALPRRSL